MITFGGRSFRHFLASSSSIVALIAATTLVPHPAAAACSTSITGTTPGCSNAATITGINIHSATVTSGVTNTGTISTNGISLNTNSTLTGGITDSGALTGGIGVDTTSRITASGTGISVHNTASLSGGISNGGTIASTRGPSILVGIRSFGGGITNSGALLGGTAVPSAAFGIDIGASTFSGGIRNTGTISGHVLGLVIDGSQSFAGGISNSGSISGIGGSAIYIDMNGGSGFSGGITNSGSGTLTGTRALQITGPSTFNGNIVNAGTINTTQVGMLVGDIGSFVGNISSTGTFNANAIGIWLLDTTMSGQISISGNFTGGILVDSLTGASKITSATTAITINASTFTGGVTNAGSIGAGQAGIRVGTSAGSPVTLFSGTVFNSGAITASLGDGIGITNVSTFAAGITNSGSISAHLDAIDVSNVETFGGSIFNAGTGTINANGATAIRVAVSTFNGSIRNSGTIHGSAAGIEVLFNTSFVGGITNSGTVSVGGNAISAVRSAQFSGGIINTTGATIAANGFGIDVFTLSTFAGGISNAGTINAGSNAIEVGTVVPAGRVTSFLGGIANSGSISATGDGIFAAQVISFSGPIVNAATGTITAGGTGLQLTFVSTFTGSITNVGTISAAGLGIDVTGSNVFGTDGAGGGVVNSGNLTATTGIKIGGTTTLQGVSTFLGGITNSGTISAGVNGIFVENVSSFAGGINNAGTINVATAAGAINIENVSNFAGGISNAPTGTITAKYTAVEVTNVSTFAGSIANDGVIRSLISGGGIAVRSVDTVLSGITNNGSISASLANILVLNVSSFAGGITNTGTLNGGAIEVVVVSAFNGGITNTGAIIADFIGINVSRVSTFNGNISNSGTIIGVEGIVVGASGSSSGVSFADGAIVNSGIIQGTGGAAIDLSNALGPVTVRQNDGTLLGTVLFSAYGDTLAGYGTVVGNVTQGNATMAPTLGSIGVMKIVGNLTQSSTSKTVIEISPAAAAQLAVTGTAALAGGLTLVFDPGTYFNKTYNLIHAGSLTGTFATTTSIDAPSGSTQSLTYSATDLDLVLSGLSISTPTGAFGDAGSIALSGAFDSDGIVFDHLDEQQFGQGADQVKTVLAGAAPIQIAMNGKLQQLAQAGAQLPNVIAQYGGWVRGVGNFLDVDNSGTASGFSASGGGFLAGIDHAIGPLTLGIAGGFSGTNFAQNDGESGDMQTLRGMLYGHYRADPQIVIDGIAGLAYDRIHTTRSIAQLGATASESHNAYESNLALQAGYVMPWQGFTLIPRIGAQYVHLSEDGFAETGGSGFDLSRGHESVDSFQPSIGVSVLKPFALDNGMRVTPQFKLAYSHELLNPSETVALTDTGGGVVPANTVTPAHNIVTLGPSATLRLNDSIDLYADYKISIGIGTSLDQVIFAGARFAW